MTTTATTTPTTATIKLIDGTLLNWLKPRKSVAIARLKNNGFALVVVLVVTQLAPGVPSLATCLWMLASGGEGMSYTARCFCWTELMALAVLSASIIQSYIAIRSPPPQCNLSGTPAKSVKLYGTPPSRPLKGFTPKLSLAKSSTTPYGSPSSTPLRMNRLPLSTSSPSPFQSSLGSSLSASLLSSPLAHRARQPPTRAVRSLRGSLLSQFEAADDDDDDYEF